jgi:8-oxo-dGTP pyrophosphatase MutT (NUDIX family)
MREDAADMVSKSAEESGIARSTGAASYRERIMTRLDREPQELKPSGDPFRPAAVIVPIVQRPEPSVLFTRRTEHLSSHAGQVCFPGGRLHRDDETLVATALRELQEETGIVPESIEVAGFLDPYYTLNTGFTILPVVGFLRPDFALSVNTHEVAEVFEVPLDFLLDANNHALKHVERGGAVREFYAISYGSHTIWGATAAMIVNLAERLRQP